MKKTIWYIDTCMGCGVRDYGTNSVLQARKAALEEVGKANFISIRKATTEEIEWVKAMGGGVK